MPFRLSTERLMPYPKQPTTIGEHILKRRCELELFQKEVGGQIGVCAWTIMNWEKGHAVPAVRYYPAIIAFLGYDPTPVPTSLGEKIVAWRRRNGITRKALAKQLGIDEAALEKREKDIASTKEDKAVKLTEALQRQFGRVSAYRAKADTT